MAINQLSALPLGTSDFIALRMANEIYVDKTEMVFSLAVNRGKYFLARPRRFGKSLLISTPEFYRRITDNFKRAFESQGFSSFLIFSLLW